MFDYHVHSEFSNDIPKGKGSTVRELCLKAIELGIEDLAITDHYDIDGCLDGYFVPLDFENERKAVFEAKEEFKDKLNVVVGLELGQPIHKLKESDELLQKYDFDVLLGSVHAVYGIEDFSEADIKSFSKNERIKLWEDYLKEFVETINWAKQDIVTHITYPKRYYLKNGISDFPDIKNKGREYFEPILKAVIDKNLALECNTSGLRQIMGECLPNEDLLRFYYDLGGRDISIGSDAHNARDIAANFKEAREMLLNIGFKNVVRYKNREKYYGKL